MKKPKNQPPELPWWVLLFPLVTILCWVAGFIHASRALRPPADLALFHFVRGTVVRNYVERKEPEELLYEGLDGMMRSLDRHSRFYPPAEARQVQEESSGAYQGIGVVVHGTRPFPTVLFPMAGSPGEKAGILPGDRVLAVEGRGLEGMALEEAIELIKGPAGTAVTLTLQRPEREDPFPLEVTRERVATSSVSKPLVLDRERGIGYLALSLFQAHTAGDVTRAWERLAARGARSLILDLRRNGGGDLEQAALLVNRFVAAGEEELVRVICRRPEDSHTYRARPEETTLAGVPLVVLVNRHSASSSEVFAAALQDWGRGLVVGEQSYGKGTVQSLVTPPAPHEDKLFKFTSARYATSSGLLVEPPPGELEAGAAGGVIPDLPVAMGEKERQALYAWLLTRDVPEPYRERVAALRRELGLPNPRRPADPQVEAALALLRGEGPLLAGKE